MSRTKKIKALYSLIGLANRAKDIGDYKLGNLTFGLGMAFLEDDEAKITYEDAGRPQSADFDIVSISLNDRCLCIPAPLLNKDTLVECLKHSTIVEPLEHNRQYRFFESLDERKKAFNVIASRYFKILREYFDINNIESALWALDLSERQKEFEEWCFRFLCQSEANTAQEVFYHFFCDEYGNQFAGHPDELCVKRDDVVKQFPQAANWPISGEHGDRFGYVLGNGVYLFPDFNFDKPEFTAI